MVGSYRYADLATFPDDHLRREIVDGDLIVTPSPVVRHQKAVGNIFFRLESYLEADRVEVYRLSAGSYPPPELLNPGESPDLAQP